MAKSKSGARIVAGCTQEILRWAEILSPKIDMDGRLAIDSAVLLLYFFVIIFIGLRMGRKERDLEDFALGRRQIPWWAVFALIISDEPRDGRFFGTLGV